MKIIHNPIINLRYWVLISIASIFGTNTGDFAVRIYKSIFDPSGVGILGAKHIGPLPFLITIYLLIYLLEKKSAKQTEFYFWSSIILIRTAATNIADSLNGDLKISLSILISVFTVLLLYLAIKWQEARRKPIESNVMPDTTSSYWFTMLIAGVLGTIIGDELWHLFGLTESSFVLGLMMFGLVYFGYKTYLVYTALYWFGIVLARIAGTAVGDWLAKSSDRGGAGLTLEMATILSGSLFLITCLLWNKGKGSQFVSQIAD